MRRLILLTVANLFAFALIAPVALAGVAGEGLLGQTSDTQVTEAGFILIIFFPTFVGLASLLQHHLEKRKHARDDARKARTQSPDWRGGW